jgi:hypothetical protein
MVNVSIIHSVELFPRVLIIGDDCDYEDTLRGINGAWG